MNYKFNEDKIINAIKEKDKSNKNEITKDEDEKILKQSKKQQLDREIKDKRKMGHITTLI